MTTPYNDVGARLRQLIETELGYENPAQFATEIGVPRQTVNNTILGKVKPSADTLAAMLSKWPGLNVTWLLLGMGKPFPFGRYGADAPANPDELVPQAISENTLLRAEKQMLSGQIALQTQYIKTLEQQLGKKSDGDPDQPGKTDTPAPKHPPVFGGCSTPRGTRGFEKQRRTPVRPTPLFVEVGAEA